MSVIRVAIPLLKGKRRFFLSKGRPWSLVEHVFLASLVIQPRTVDQLATQADVPRRLVLEALIRLMRAGWVVLDQTSNGVIFSASDAGKSVVEDEELPQVSKAISRWMNFVIDKLTGTVYRSRELPFLERHVVEQRATRERLVWLKPRDISFFNDTGGMLAALFDSDEKFTAIEPSGDRMVDRFALITVRNGEIEGLPARAPLELRFMVLEAAKLAPGQPIGANSPQADPIISDGGVGEGSSGYIKGTIKLTDIILGGPAHEEVLRNSIKRAKSRLIIHSTFISESRFVVLQPLLYDAVKRGVVIDVLWGEDDDKVDLVTSSKTVNKLRELIEIEGFSDSLRLHPFSTRSHAKILIADDGRHGEISGTLGSCNWLSSGFQTYEASVRFTDPEVVACILEQVADLSRGYDGHWTELTSNIARLAAEARSQRPPSGLKANVTVVVGAQHAEFMRLARDEASKRIFITSHRLGSAARAAVLVPAIAAVRDRGVAVTAYYGIPTGSVDADRAAHLSETSQQAGVEISPVTDPRLHAKILAWDDDSLLITSQNWLSADPSISSGKREIGVFVEAKGAADWVISDFELHKKSSDA